MICEICGKAPGTRWLSYNGMAGAVWACSKKLHDLSAKDRRKVKLMYRGVLRKHRSSMAADPIKTPDLSKLSELVTEIYKKVTFAVTRQEAKEKKGILERIKDKVTGNER